MATVDSALCWMRRRLLQEFAVPDIGFFLVYGEHTVLFLVSSACFIIHHREFRVRTRLVLVGFITFCDGFWDDSHPVCKSSWTPIPTTSPARGVVDLSEPLRQALQRHDCSHSLPAMALCGRRLSGCERGDVNSLVLRLLVTNKRVSFA